MTVSHGGMNGWTIAELGDAVRAALRESGHSRAASGRVTAVPNPRTIRYYSTIGLVDRPTAMWGRTALYGRRHLLQLVAIKHLQARGLSLEAIQGRLAGLPSAELERLVAVRPDLQPSRLTPSIDPPGAGEVSASPSSSSSSSSSGRKRFWAAVPVLDSEPPQVSASESSSSVGDHGPSLTALPPEPRQEPDFGAGPPAAPAPAPVAGPAAAPVAGPVAAPVAGPAAAPVAGPAAAAPVAASAADFVGIALGSGAVLLVTAGIPALNIEAIRAAARPLVDEIVRQGAVGSRARRTP